MKSIRNINLVSIVVAISLVAGCATSNAPTSSIAGQPTALEVTPSTFKLNNYLIKWIPSTELKIEMRCATNAMTLQRVCSSSQAATSRSNQDIALMNQLLQANATTQLNSRLLSKGLKEGDATTIELKPQSGYWSEAGWGSGVLIEVTVTEANSGRKWTHVLPADTGVQFFGAMAAGPQTSEYVASFTTRLDSVLSRAGFY
jgi:hypothetical protein